MVRSQAGSVSPAEPAGVDEPVGLAPAKPTDGIASVTARGQAAAVPGMRSRTIV